jgi:hypothetical protein
MQDEENNKKEIKLAEFKRQGFKSLNYFGLFGGILSCF